MATGKRYYWIKLRESFMTSDTVDFLMSQKDGANYVVLYQMLCLKTINTGGRLSRTIGEIVIPYDVEKIQRDCKWFSADTIRVALNLYKRFGLIYEERDGTLALSEHDSMVGTETDWSEKKRRQRSELPSGDNVPSLVPSDVPQSVPTDIRDKSLDTRDKSTEKDIKKDTSCAERSDDPSTQEEKSPIVFKLETNDGAFYEVTQAEVDKYSALYPAVDIEQEYRKMIGWIDGNKRYRKTLRGMPRFINGWLARAQDHAKGGVRNAANRRGPDEGPRRVGGETIL